MKKQKYSLWSMVPGTMNYEPWLEHYEPDTLSSDSAVLIIPGSGYNSDPAIPKQEGKKVAEYFCAKGINAFVLRYRVAPDAFPVPILDGRRAVRYIRYFSHNLGINKNKIAIIGFSAGGHLAASLCIYTDRIEYEELDDIDNESYVPNYQVLCYPVIGLNKDNYYIHKGSADNLLGNRYEELKTKLSFECSNVHNVPPTFIWHNFDDNGVSVVNSLKYAENLKRQGTSVELHIFPDGGHGIGLSDETNKIMNHAGKWIKLLDDWFCYHNFYI